MDFNNFNSYMAVSFSFSNYLSSDKYHRCENYMYISFPFIRIFYWECRRFKTANASMETFFYRRIPTKQPF